jgi:hypothetical protein
MDKGSQPGGAAASRGAGQPLHKEQREMTSKLRAIGLALLGIAALAMFAATGAYAAQGQLHIQATGGSAVTTGHQHGVTGDEFELTASGAKTQCTQATFEGTVTDENAIHNQTQVTAKEGQLTGTYTGCKIEKPINLGAATVDMNGCKYTLKASQTDTTATVEIKECTKDVKGVAKPIEITTAVGCTIDVPEQAERSHITYTNVEEGGVKHITSHVTVQGITYQFTGIFCPEATNVLHHDGDYRGTQNFFGYQHSGTELRKHNGHEYKAFLHPVNPVNMFAD